MCENIAHAQITASADEITGKKKLIIQERLVKLVLIKLSKVVFCHLMDVMHLTWKQDVPTVIQRPLCLSVPRYPEKHDGDGGAN